MTPEEALCLSPLRLDLGSGPAPLEGHVGVDRIPAPNVLEWSFASFAPWPLPDESVDELHSSHLIEHLPPPAGAEPDPFFRFFEQAWRVAKMGALFRLRWPMPFHPETHMPLESAWWDPTHYRRVPIATVDLYLSERGRQQLGVTSYGVACNWAIIRGEMRQLGETGLIFEYDVTLEKRPLGVVDP